MIPIPSGRKAAIINWVPKTLGGIVYPFIETQRNIPRPECPAIIGVFTSAGQISRGRNTLLFTIRTRNGTLDDYWGQWHLATLAISLRSYDPDELADMHEDFVRKVMFNCRELTRYHMVKFLEILRSESLPMDFQRESEAGQQMFMAAIDLRFEYAMINLSTADLILNINEDLEWQRLANEPKLDPYAVPPAAKALHFEYHVLNPTIDIALRAAVEDTRTLSVGLRALVEE